MQLVPVADPGVPSLHTEAERFAPLEGSGSTFPWGAQTGEKKPHYQTNVKAHKHNDFLLLVMRRQRNKCTTSENKALSVSINTPTL